MKPAVTSILLVALGNGPIALAFRVPEFRTRLPRVVDNAPPRASAISVALDATLENESEPISLLSSTRSHALEVFERYASEGNYDGQKFISDPSLFFQLLCSLDVEATEEDANIVFRFLDSDGDGRLLFDDEFLPWYLEAVGAASGVASSFQSLLVGRRTVEVFDQTPVDDAVLERAVQCAIAAPNRSGSEPWRFRKLGPETIRKLAALNSALAEEDAENGKFTRYTDWATVAPGWCVVTLTISGSDASTNVLDTLTQSEQQQDFKSVCCAIQNLMLSMWSEGIGTKWTTGPVQTTPEFADICRIDTSEEVVVGIVWYGYATGGTKYADPKRRKLAVEDVLGYRP
mmetsp:Transcript_23075/g.63976  ORF Transcript_23075/g.63976 Transcript_23075/m.63976 type:complete len:345 (+) Transcript_23075:200-1234(+)|eukprot:CAMPEP_0172369994 /NCGR_PEP_ID=MMETSP1060-20121228/35589_1 /TAXON_ID=37318 /ORGANISM="Pseudo-nitzschia pungens, Strain cf. cingulata" /LENGTH=344 /DNA_ID=CAMNT_0013095107 /DNA_START=70 /DNA_END=1104 /DNA_ORIENTATION=+